MKRVSAARGMRLVSRKLRSSCWVKEAIRALTVMNLSARSISACCHGNDTPDSLTCPWPPQRPLPPPSRSSRRGSTLSRAKHRSLAGHSKMSRRVARLLPFYEFDGDKYFGCDGAPDERGDAAQGRLLPPRRALRRSLSQGPRDDEGSGGDDLRPATSPKPTACRSSSRVSSASIWAPATFMESSSGVTVTDVDGNTSYDLTGSYGVNIFGNDFYKECIEGAEKRAHALGPVLGPYHPVIARQRAAALPDLGPRRGLVPHVRHRSRDAGGAARALPHQAHASGSLRRRLSRLVGRRAARRRQSGRRRTRPTRWPRCRSGRCMCCARARTSPACWSIRCRRCIRTATRPAIPRWSIQLARRQFRSRGLHRMAEAAARGLHRARHRADLRRGLRRLPPRRRRRAGIFRRQGRHGDLRQEPRRRPAGRRGLRQKRADAPLPRRSSRRHLLRPRHLQLASLRHDGDGRVPEPARQPELPRHL